MSDASRSAGQQDGLEGRQDAKERLTGLQQYNLDELRQKLTGESEWQQNGRNQFALFHQGALRAGLFGFKASTGVLDHKVNGHVTIHVLQGSLRVVPEGQQDVTVGGNGFVAFDAANGFSVEAREDSFAVFTFCQAEGVAESAKGNAPGTQVTG